MGWLLKLRPAGDSAIGFSGSTNLLVIWNEKDRLSSVSVRSSGDTKEHLDAILEDSDFFKQFKGKSRKELARGQKLSAVSGATLTSLAIADALALRFGASGKASRFPDPVRIEEIVHHFPDSPR